MSLINDLKSEWKKALIGLIVVTVIAKGEKIVGYFETGKEAEDAAKMEVMLVKSLQKDAVMIELLNNKRFIQFLLESDEVKEFEKQAGMKIRDEIVEQVTKSDTDKVSMRSFLGKEIGLRDEDVLPFLADFMKQVKEGNIATKEDIKEIKRRLPRRTPVSSH
jgi:hypothetical protein